MPPTEIIFGCCCPGPKSTHFLEENMIQAYFEEWSRRPGDRVRMAISTPHARVRAVLERINTGPGGKGEFRVGTESFESVLDRTFPGRLQNTSVGSYVNLPLPSQGIGDRLT